MEEKIQSVQYRDSEPSEFAHKPPKQEMDLSCFPGRLSPIGSPHRLDLLVAVRSSGVGGGGKPLSPAARIDHGHAATRRVAARGGRTQLCRSQSV